MSPNPLSDADFLKKLNAYPELKQQFYALLLSIEDESGPLTQADAAELQIIEQMRRMGNATLTAWAGRVHDQEASASSDQRRVRKDGKKTELVYDFGEVGIVEQQFRQGTKRLRPFAGVSGVHHRGTSRPLQRVIVDLRRMFPIRRRWISWLNITGYCSMRA